MTSRCYQVGCQGIIVLSGLFFIVGCGIRVRPAISPTASPVPVDSFVRARSSDDTSHLFGQLGLEQFAFDCSAPENVTCTTWMKTYVGGTLDRQLCRIEKLTPAKGERLSGRIFLNRYDPSDVSETDSSRTRWYFGTFGSVTSWWLDDPFKKADSEMPLSYNHENLGLGETYTIGCLLGAARDESGSCRFSGEGSEAEIAAKHAVAVFIKMRFDIPDELRDHPTGEGTSAQVPEFDDTP
ncbi:MAG: hypothetical protein GXX96_01000 [Planctomycetaceae bacterium]|nr:hypothetical protein [Planctomycetaceae bacterium]